MAHTGPVCIRLSRAPLPQPPCMHHTGLNVNTSELQHSSSHSGRQALLGGRALPSSPARISLYCRHLVPCHIMKLELMTVSAVNKLDFPPWP